MGCGFLGAALGQAAESRALLPEFDGKDATRSKIAVQLVEMASGFANPTDLAPIPGDPDRWVVLEKGGTLQILTRSTGQKRLALRRAVRTRSELGLLGIAFHPKFSKNRRIYLNYNPEEGPMRT